ncbi:MAG: XRE family transcriptional regulator [Proteobacteria bacterium]|nr:MAG: XRE family transcriptional regulator [Pseudomonadota bacterium]
MEIAEAFGIVLRRNREKMGLSQEELALNCSLDRTFISLLERGLRQPSLATVFNIGEQLKITSSELVRQVERTRKKGGRKTLPRLPSSRA